MKNILDELYNYNLFHLTKIEDVKIGYKVAFDRLVKAEAELRKEILKSNDILDTYHSTDIDLHNLINRNELRKDFRVSAQFVLEMIKPISRCDRYEQI